MSKSKVVSRAGLDKRGFVLSEFLLKSSGPFFLGSVIIAEKKK